MYANNTFSTSGVVVAIFFGATAAITAGLMIFFCCKEKRQHKAWLRADAARIIAAEQKKSQMSVSVREVEEDGRPLIGGGRV